MGKAAKAHRKKVAARNARSQEKRNQFHKILQQLDERMRQPQPEAPMPMSEGNLQLTANEYKPYDDEVEI
jgi:hypothetical protein